MRENACRLVRIVLVLSRIGYREVPCDISANHRVQQFDTKTLLNHSVYLISRVRLVTSIARAYFPFVNGLCHFVQSMPPLVTREL